MALDKQVKIFCADTRNFYSGNEERLHDRNQSVRFERKELMDAVSDIEKKLKKNHGFSEVDIKELAKGKFEYTGENQAVIDLISDYAIKKKLIKHKAEIAKSTKERLQKLLEHKAQANIASDGKHHSRVLSNGFDGSDKNIITVFESSFTRMIGAKTDELSDDFMVVECYYYDVINDIVHFGFMFNGEKYIYFTSSAGQIRTKKCVFIKESVYKRYEKTLMCGLSIDAINAKGGNNITKTLAYMALSSSATDLWTDFDIDKTIVIDDFETQVFGTYDYIDMDDYSITRKDGYVPITHTDGCGMMLPKWGRNRQVRLPWCKGLISPFDFVAFIKEHDCSPVIKDIYGQEHDVIAEDIQFIFTKSMFKMWKYYDSWEQYKSFYKEYGCTAGYANMEDERKPNATINYQMLQSLTDITDDEIKKIASRTIYGIENVCSSIENVQKTLGVAPYGDMSPFQKAVNIYPNLLNDKSTKNELREKKDARVKEAKCGKLRLKCKYSFVLPDFYAACQHWFCGVKNPNGLLSDGEVFAWLSKKYNKVDCLRSPHLYREHAVRKNVAYNGNDRQAELRKWYGTDAVYTSCQDLISKLLMFDCDGDTLLVVSDETFVKVAERNMKGIVPLYYEMKKANNVIISNDTIWKGLSASFSSKSIGIYSNAITKIWNSEVFISGSDEEKEEALTVIKLLCAENNFSIDAAKTSYMPVRPKEIDKIIKKYTKLSLPAFFKYVKDKTDEQVGAVNGSLVNKLDSIIPNVRINMRKLKINKPDPMMMMYRPYADFDYHYKLDEHNNIIEEETAPLIVAFHHIMTEYSLRFISISELGNNALGYKRNEMTQDEATNYKYGGIIKEIREELSHYGYNLNDTVDILVKYSYERELDSKKILWLCYGEEIYNNLEPSVRHKDLLDRRLGINNKSNRKREVQCVDCGEWFFANIRAGSTCRCEECTIEHNKIKKHSENQRYRQRLKKCEKIAV